MSAFGSESEAIKPGALSLGHLGWGAYSRWGCEKRICVARVIAAGVPGKPHCNAHGTCDTSFGVGKTHTALCTLKPGDLDVRNSHFANNYRQVNWQVGATV